MGKIEWTDRSDWNPVRGCTRVSEGCRNCYAEIMAARFSKPGQWGHGFAEMRDGDHRWTGNVRLQEDRLALPLSWRKPAKVFMCSTADLFHESLPFEDIDKVFAVMGLAAGHTFQVLTKRADRMREYMTEWLGKKSKLCDEALQIVGSNKQLWAATIAMQLRDHGFLRNVWLGVSVEDQARADERVPLLLETPAAVRFLSCEPLLGPLVLRRYLNERARNIEAAQYAGAFDWPGCGQAMHAAQSGLHWVICGSESGIGARPCDLNWVRDLRDQCSGAGVAFFWKQHAERGRKIPTPHLDGRQWLEYPGTR